MSSPTPPQPEEGLREKIDFYRRMFGITDLDFNVQMLQLFQSTMLSCEPTITLADLELPLPTSEEYERMVWILNLNNKFWRANILKACGDPNQELKEK